MTQPLFDWLDKRSAGILLHPTSLPGDLGIGTLGRNTRTFIDFLHASGFEYWQVCPLGPTGFGDSPYQCFSAFAGNPYLIDLHQLVSWGLLNSDDLIPLQKLRSDLIDYGGLFQTHKGILHKAYKKFVTKPSAFPYLPEWDQFLKAETHWLTPYATFRAFKFHFKGKPWFEWPQKYRSYHKAIKTPLLHKLEKQIEAHQFYQFLFFHQWSQTRQYAASKSIKIIGDIPIFVAADSADTWANPRLFQLSKEGLPSRLAGVPPDYFTKLGQFWGNPLYDWKVHKEKGYSWWFQRLEANFQLYDVIRLDHFRGFDTYWSIPAGAADARSGKWVQGPGIDFFKAIKHKFPSSQFIAEDLGQITPGVDQLREDSGIPGMAILQFAFDRRSTNPFLPHNIKRNIVIYTGTHDNNTTQGWYQPLPPDYRDQVRRYLRVSGDDIAWDLIRLAYQSIAYLAVIPMQDILNKGEEARMNLPGSAHNNWQWRLSHKELQLLSHETVPYLQELKWLFNR